MSFRIHVQARLGLQVQCIEVNFFIQLKFTAAWALYNVTGKNEPLILKHMNGMTIGYPLKISATFKCNDQALKRMWTLGCRRIQYAAAQICHNTPYQDQLHYTGDTRIQAITAVYLSGEDRLMKKAILDFYNSRSARQVTNGYNLGSPLKVIPTFSLFWISLVYDYWMHRKDDDFIIQFLPSIQGILDWYERQMKGDQDMIGAIKWWNIIDFYRFNSWGVTPAPESASSAIVSLQFAYTLKQAAKLFSAFGNPDRAKRYTNLAEKINDDAMRFCFNEEKALMADTPEKISYSQHANIWAILSGAVEDKKAKKVMIHTLYDKSLAQATFFYKSYLTQALKKTGLQDQYYSQLKPWERTLDPELKTVTERIEPEYSERNEWSAQPCHDFLTTICGITSVAPAFERVQIQPALGPLLDIEGMMSHPEGPIIVKYRRIGKTGIHAEIDIPETIQGDFIWDGRMFLLRGGKQTIECSAVRELMHEY
ncbi:alpha-L-rhamnosidase [Pedobacter steynii]|uniref:Alpha-L-rhamnosidase n=1 Tax=Pedobacter steynii TaxID=430522 RepID=A0A1G9RY86_9SPHI|nr:family 78 glycoside hydrolase catalytic domain [Pedobacter steynii]NQX37611.1 family 78 glycoside hydrolase catalytic domain [Pedobacter steynii]SDM27980.1 alpha-L-rhamnosidase [Pedobacter steynii]